MLTGGVADGMDVKTGSLWLSRKLAETLDQLLLKIVSQAFLFPKEDNTTLRD